MVPAACEINSIALSPVPGTLLAKGFRRTVLGFLAKNDARSEALRCRMHAWRHCGFLAHNEVSEAAEDIE